MHEAEYDIKSYADRGGYPPKPYKLSNGNRTEWSPIQSVIIRVIAKFVFHEYDYRLNSTTRSPIINYS